MGKSRDKLKSVTTSGLASAKPAAKTEGSAKPEKETTADSAVQPSAAARTQLPPAAEVIATGPALAMRESDAIARLKSDHRTLEGLFAAYAGADSKARLGLARQIYTRS